MCYHLQMPRIDTVASPAKMINVHSCWNRATVQFIGEAVSIDSLATSCIPELSIAVSSHSPGPVPAPSLHELDFLPESFHLRTGMRSSLHCHLLTPIHLTCAQTLS